MAVVDPAGSPTADMDQPPFVAEPSDGGDARLNDSSDRAFLPLNEGRKNRCVVPRNRSAMMLPDGLGYEHRGERNDPSRCNTY